MEEFSVKFDEESRRLTVRGRRAKAVRVPKEYNPWGNVLAYEPQTGSERLPDGSLVRYIHFVTSDDLVLVNVVIDEIIPPPKNQRGAVLDRREASVDAPEKKTEPVRR